MDEKKEIRPQIRKLFGIAKCPELRLSDEELHLVVQKCTGKCSIRELSGRELATAIRELGRMKDAAKNDRKPSKWGGNPQTERQRQKIRALERELGWDKPSRVNGMAKRMFGCNDVRWLTYQQCSKLIEALKKMAERKEAEGEPV